MLLKIYSFVATCLLAGAAIWLLVLHPVPGSRPHSSLPSAPVVQAPTTAVSQALSSAVPDEQARTLSDILEKEGEVGIRMSEYAYLHLTAKGEYLYSTGPDPLSGMLSKGTWTNSGQFIILAGDWQPVNAMSYKVTKSWKVFIDFLRKDPSFDGIYKGCVYFEEITPSQRQPYGNQTRTR